MELYLHKRNHLIHIAVWIVYLVLLTWFFLNFNGFGESITKSLIFVCVHAIVFYLNLNVLLPKFLEKKHYALYFLLVIGLIALTIILFNTFERFVDYQEIRNTVKRHGRQGPGRGQVRMLAKQFELGRMVLNGIVVVAVLFISTIYRSIAEGRRREQNEIALQNKVLEAEKSFLKSQMNPHFLFNTLNNIYSLSLAKSDNTAESIHRLSEMLRYVLYESDEKNVRLEKEIKYIEAYIQLQLLRDDEIENVNLDIGNIDNSFMIAPMILIPFIENSFKHSKIEDTENGWINITIKTVSNKLIFTIENSIPAIIPSKDKSSGVGLTNTKRRLELLYPDKHTLNIIDSGEKYAVQLKIDLNEN